MGLITKRFGSTIEIRYQDAPLFDPARARHVLTAQARAFFELALQDLAGYISDEAPVGVSGNLAQSFGGSMGDGGTEIKGSSIEELEGRVFSVATGLVAPSSGGGVTPGGGGVGI